MIKNIERVQGGIDSLIDQAHDAVVGGADAAERGVDFVAERVVDTAHVAGEYVRDGAETATRGAHRGVKDAAKAVDRGYARARDEVSRAGTAITDYVATNPGKMLLLAVSAGFVLGILVCRRRT